MKHKRIFIGTTQEFKSISWKYIFFLHSEYKDFTTSNTSEYSQDSTEHIYIRHLLQGKTHTEARETVFRQAVRAQGISKYKLPRSLFTHRFTYLQTEPLRSVWGICLQESSRQNFPTGMCLALGNHQKLWTLNHIS